MLFSSFVIPDKRSKIRSAYSLHKNIKKRRLVVRIRLMPHPAVALVSCYSSNLIKYHLDFYLINAKKTRNIRNVRARDGENEDLLDLHIDSIRYTRSSRKKWRKSIQLLDQCTMKRNDTFFLSVTVSTRKS